LKPEHYKGQNGLMNCFELKELSSRDGWTIRLKYQFSKNGIFKRSTELLNLLVNKDIQKHYSSELSMAHLLGERAWDNYSLEQRKEELDCLALTMHEFLTQTLGLKKSKRKRNRLTITLEIVNPSGELQYSSIVLNWTETNIKSYLKAAQRFRTLTDRSDLITLALSFWDKY
jgi:hypothetical protein